MARADIRERVEEAARFLRIDHLLDRPVSRPCRRRPAARRARPRIVRRPMAFLMDEPLGTLDAEFRDFMVRELRELHNRIGRRPSTSPTTSSRRWRWPTRSRS